MNTQYMEVQENDVYFLEIVNNKILINDNYEGIIVFDDHFNVLKKIYFFNDFIIDLSIKNGNEILFICSDINKIIYLNLLNYQTKIISLKGFESYIFSSLFEWHENLVILVDYKENHIKIDLIKEKIEALDKKEEILFSIRNATEELRGGRVLKRFALEKKAVIEKSYNEIEVINYSNGINTIIKIGKGKFHDYEITDKFIAQIGEDKVNVSNLEENEQRLFLPKKGYCFLRGKFMVKENKIYVYLLSGNKSNECIVRIEKYLL